MMKHLTNKRIIVLILTLMGLTTYVTCHSNNKDYVMPSPDQFLELTLHATANELYDNNADFESFQKLTKGPIGRDQKGFDFPTGSQVTAQFNYPNGQLILNNISFVNVMDDTRVKEYRLPDFTIATFLRGKDPKNITDQEAYEQVNAIFKQLEKQGWEYNFNFIAPRITPKTAVEYAMAGGDASYLDYRYPLSFEQFNQITSYIHRWYLRHGTDTFLEIEMWRNVEDNGDTTILFAYDFHDQLHEIYRHVEPENQGKASESLTEQYSNPPFIARLWSESKVVAKGLTIDKSLTSYTFPLVKQKTGFDTAKIINTDPYKLTYDEFLEKRETNEDLTPYLEPLSEEEPEITSRATGRCPAKKSCPKSGYWFTLAKADSRNYFKQGNIMPDYPNNQWGEVIWQFEGEQG